MVSTYYLSAVGLGTKNNSEFLSFHKFEGLTYMTKCHEYTNL